VLEPIDHESTRLITRASGEYGRLGVGLMLGLVWRPLDFGMQRRQLLNVKRRARQVHDDARPSPTGRGLLRPPFQISR